MDRVCGQCGRRPSGLVQNATHCEFCGAPLQEVQAPPEPLERKCYTCGKPFPGDKRSEERRCEACRAVVSPVAEAAASDGVALDEGTKRIALHFVGGLLAVPAWWACVWVVKLVWQAVPGLVVFGFLGLLLLSKILWPLGGRPNRRGTFAENAAMLVGAAVSLAVFASLA
ncbi:MAG: hypothetical protein AB1938_08830 [Myxococcota bacterium]